MLTGDKMETAENIARSCKLIQQDMTLMSFSEKSLEYINKKMIENLEIVQLCKRENRKRSLVVDGEALSIIESSPELSSNFVQLTKDCDSVVCCRVTPKQKAAVVRLIKNNLNKVTLAIGDGANDVNMIQEAHIGIGIYGKEGMRAVQSSDFAIGEFQCLWRLLLIHGRWCYVRTSHMIIYFFYKNMIFTIPHFFFSFACASSAQTIFDDWYISFYNLFFTALPLIIRAVFEQDVDYKMVKQNLKKSQIKVEEVANPIAKPKKKYLPFLIYEDSYLKKEIPKLYYVGQEKTIFKPSRFIYAILWAICQSLLLFALNYLVFENVIFNNNGYNGDIWSFSITYFTTIILLVDFKLAIKTTHWIFLNWVALIPFSILLYFAYFFISNYISTNWSYLTPMTLIGIVQFYAAVLLGLLGLFAVDFLVYVVPIFLFDSKVLALVKYSREQRNHYDKMNEKDRSLELNNKFIEKEEDMDEKIVGDIEISLQKHHSIERVTTINKLNILKL